MPGGLLDGIRVLDLTVWRPGPYCTQLLAEMGADVLKIEPPGGDPMRQYPGLFAGLNVNKRSVVLDLKAAEGRARALELAAEADAVIEGFRPGVAERLGVGVHAVQAANPSVVYCSVSGMGQTGPLADAPGHDLNYQAWAGTLAPDGGRAVMPQLPVADLAAGAMAAFALCAALVRRQATGEGERIDLAIADVLATWTGAEAARSADGPSPVVPGYGVFDAADGRQLTLGVLSEDHFWSALCTVLDMAEAGVLGFAERCGRGAELQAEVAARLARRPCDVVLDQLMAAGVPAAPVLDRAGMLGLGHFAARGVVTADPWADPSTGHPVRFTRHPARRTSPPPDLDQHRGAGFLPRPAPGPGGS